jgi:hypothetical protein
MLTSEFTSAFNLLTRFGWTPPAGPMRTFLRPRLRPPPGPFVPRIRTAQQALLDAGRALPRQLAEIRRDFHFGSQPTIVLAGFVPDAADQVLLIRNELRRHGSVYYLHYSRRGFSTDLLCAQLDDLVEELAACHGQRPVILTVSFGCGLLLEWFRRSRLAGRTPDLAGVVLISPVACAADLIDPAAAKPDTLVGRALQPFLAAGGTITPEGLQKSRAVFTRMFDAGAQNREALGALFSPAELADLRRRITDAIHGIDAPGALERVRSLTFMPGLEAMPGQAAAVTPSPALLLYAEKESSVLTATSPTRAALTRAHQVFFPRGRLCEVCNTSGSPVQHASLIFHAANFLPYVRSYYAGLKMRKLAAAA